MKTVLHNCKIFTGKTVLADHAIIVDQDIIAGVSTDIPADAKHIDLEGANISAGFIDIHINGGEKFYFSQHPNEATLHDICQTSKLYGTTHVLPCLITSAHDTIISAIGVVKDYMHRHNEGVVGMHLEGPFINPLKRGAHPASQVRKPTMKELDEIITCGRDVIKVMTIAPECFDDEQLELLLDSGFIISAGHSNMTYEQAQYYFSKGISLVTHLFNAMTQLQHREPGLAGATLNNNNVYAPIILDGGHCSYAAAEIAWKLKQEKLFLISDAALLSRKVKSFKFGDFDAILGEDGFYRNSEGTLAGSAISMQEAVQNAMKFLKIPLIEAIRMATIYAARAIKMEDKLGFIAPGYLAHFCVFNDSLSSCKTIIV